MASGRDILISSARGGVNPQKQLSDPVFEKQTDPNVVKILNLELALCGDSPTYGSSLVANYSCHT